MQKKKCTTVTFFQTHFILCQQQSLWSIDNLLFSIIAIMYEMCVFENIFTLISTNWNVPNDFNSLIMH